jgi:tetratricopeptide (TPR) repeat protein
MLVKRVSLILLLWLFFSGSPAIPVVDTGLGSIKDSLLWKIEQTHKPVEKVNLYLKLIEQLMYNQPSVALGYGEQALQLAKDGNLTICMPALLNRMADIRKGMTDYQTALDLASRAMEMASGQENLREMAESHRIIGILYTDLGDYQQSSGHLFECLKLIEQTGDHSAIARAYNSIGYLCFEQQNFEKALEYYIQALDICRKSADFPGISRGLNNVAAIYFETNRNDSAEKYFREAVLINRKIGQRLWEGINYQNLGEVKMEQHRYSQALEFYLLGMDIFMQMNNINQLSSLYLNISAYCDSIGDMAGSREYAEKAYTLSREHKLRKVTMYAAAKLQRYYRQQGDLENAYRYGMIHYEIKDSLELEQSMIKFARLDQQYAADKQKQEEKLLRQRNHFTLVIVIISSILLLLLVLWLMTRQKMKAREIQQAKEKLQDEVDMKNKELALNVMNLIRKNEIITGISDRLMKVEQGALQQELKDAISLISRDLQKNTEVEIWEEFELRFKQVNGEFYQRLMQQFPDLTQGEQRLCAFLKLNLSSKEISRLTGQQIPTLVIARHRLRKKLGISNTQQNLFSFLNRI